MIGGKRHNKHSSIARGAMFLIIVMLVVYFIGMYLLRGSIVKESAVVYLPKGTTYESLLDTLKADGGRITHIGRFETFADLMKLEQSVKPGRYELRPGMSAKDVVGMFRGGAQSPLKITFNNIRTIDDLAGRLGAQLMADSMQFLTLLTDNSIAQKYDFKPEELIGMFIPNTYEVYWTISPEALLDRMKSEYDKFWTSRADKLNSAKLTPKQVSTLASIVEEETNLIAEMPMVAGVYINRLNKRMRLQADPTVKFAVGDPSLQRVLKKHLQTDSPYNTYRYGGLPPGPIRMPSIQAIDAVLNYDRHSYLYFCAKPDFSGQHAFAKTLEEHNRNARAYTQALNAAGIK